MYIYEKCIKFCIIGSNRNQHQEGVEDRLPPPSQRSNQYQYNRSSGQGNVPRERRGGGAGGSNSAPRGNRGGGNRRVDDRRRTADDEHTVLDSAQDSGDRGNKH